MFEKKFVAVSPQPLIANGTVDGKITIPDTRFFKVKQKVILKSNTQSSKDTFEVKRILSPTVMLIGPLTGRIDVYSDMSPYLVADMATIEAIEQNRPSIPSEEHDRAIYEEEPVVADRVILVDEYGDKYNQTNRFPVEATVNLTASKPNKHTIFNYIVPAPNVEHFIVLPADTEIMTIRARNNSRAVKVQYSFVAGESGTKYITIMPGVRKEISGLGLSTPTPLYFQLSLTETGGTILEVETWSF